MELGVKQTCQAAVKLTTLKRLHSAQTAVTVFDELGQHGGVARNETEAGRTCETEASSDKTT